MALWNQDGTKRLGLVDLKFALWIIAKESSLCWYNRQHVTHYDVHVCPFAGYNLSCKWYLWNALCNICKLHLPSSLEDLVNFKRGLIVGVWCFMKSSPTLKELEAAIIEEWAPFSLEQYLHLVDSSRPISGDLIGNFKVDISIIRWFSSSLVGTKLRSDLVPNFWYNRYCF